MRRRLIRLAVVVIGLAALATTVTVGLAGIDALRGYRSLRAARDDFMGAEPPATIARLEKAQMHFAEAEQRVGSPWLTPVRVVPVIGHHLRAFERMVTGAATVSDIGRDAVAAFPDLDARPRGSDRADLARELGEVAKRASERLDAVDVGSDAWLVTPFANQHRRFATDLADLKSLASKAVKVSEGSSAFLTGPRRYLVLAANNGEMRAGQGMFLSAGVLTVRNGSLDLGEMTPTAQMQLDDKEVALRGSLADLWAPLHPNREWRNLGVSPRFDQSAELASRMWRARGGDPVDGVISVDVLAVQALLEATGEVRIGDTKIDADNVVDHVLHDQYEGVPATAGATAERREALAALASSVIERFDNSAWDLPSLATGLGGAGAGRHFLAWSSRRGDQQMWAAAGVDGRLGEDSVLLGLLNRAGNKLDQFIDIDTGLNVADGEQGRSDVTLRVTLRNETPRGEPAYIQGPHPLSNTEAGEYSGVLAVSLPGAARRARIDGVEQLQPGGRDGPTTVVGVPVRIKRGGTATFVIRFELTQSQRRLVVEPSGRIPPTAWRFRGTRWTDSTSRELVW
jgi:hypothetical protein